MSACPNCGHDTPHAATSVVGPPGPEGKTGPFCNQIGCNCNSQEPVAGITLHLPLPLELVTDVFNACMKHLPADTPTTHLQHSTIEGDRIFIPIPEETP